MKEFLSGLILAIFDLGLCIVFLEPKVIGFIESWILKNF